MAARMYTLKLVRCFSKPRRHEFEPHPWVVQWCQFNRGQPNLRNAGIPMKAIVYHKYGSPDVLKLEEVQEPTPRDDEVLIKVHAASVNDWDWGLLRGKPFANRVLSGLLKPKRIKILGADIAGRVEAVGRNFNRDSPDQTTFPGYSSRGDTAKYNPTFQERQMRPDSLKFHAFIGQPLYCQA